jgi:hypothetical protein
MTWLFIVGLALELAGAVLLAAELLTLDPGVLAMRGNLYPQSGEPHLDAQVPASTDAGRSDPAHEQGRTRRTSAMRLPPARRASSRRRSRVGQLCCVACL